MDKNEIAVVLTEVAAILDLLGENRFKVIAYQNAARTLENLQEDLGELIAHKRLGEIKGFGPAIQDKVTELYKTGKLRYYDELKRSIPAGLLQLLRIPSLGPKKVKILWTDLQVESVQDLKDRCDKGLVAELKGFGEKTQAKILDGISNLDKYRGYFLWAEAWVSAQPILERLRKSPLVEKVELGGSVRRKKEVIRDIDFLCSTKKPEAVMELFIASPGVREVLNHGETKASVILENGIQCDLRCVNSEQYPFALTYFTGSKEHNIVLRQRAIERDLKLNEYGLFPAKGSKPSLKCKDEAAIYEKLGLPYIEPEIREDTGEVEAAEAGKLPKLIEWKDIRGTFHCHTTASDGADSLEAMGEAARKLGWEYLGIADHSKASAIANGLDEKRLLTQIQQIDALNARWKDFRLFKGTEVDVLLTGALDFSDEILAQLDYVVASVHSSLGTDKAKNTARVIKAISNPYVTILGHATGRLLLSREGMKLDMTAVLEAAAETRTVVELNCTPSRMDLDWRYWKGAAQKGILCAIDPDAHGVGELEQVRMGVNVARKGWLTARTVLNARDAANVETFLKTPKNKRAP
jgi:DNA polymerase (family X)